MSSLLDIRLPDSALYTPEGRRLLVSLGVVEPDPLRVEAERWLASHEGPKTEAVVAVRAALGPSWPREWLDAAQRMRDTPWRDGVRNPRRTRT